MSHGTMNADEDDWETADLSGIKAPDAKGKKTGNLRPSAPQFTPRSSSSSPTKPDNAALPTSQGRAPAMAPPVRLMSRSNAGASGSGTGNNAPRLLSREATRENADDDWFGARGKVTNRQIWESANTATAGPPVILAPTAQPLPQPSIQILRRDQAQQGTASRQNETQAPQKTLEEREEQYRLARERIFGPTPSPSASTSTSSANAAGAPNSAVALVQNSTAPGQTASSTASTSRSSSKQGRKRSAKTTTPGSQQHQQQQQQQQQSMYSQQYPQQAMYGAPDLYAPSVMLGPTPHQIRAAPVPGSLRTAPTQGIVRQPRGPEAGGGFASATPSSRSATPAADYSYGASGGAYGVQGVQSYAGEDGKELDDQMAHWMSQASFGSMPRQAPGRY